MVDLSSIKPQERMIDIHHPGNDTIKIGLRITLMALSDPRMKRIKRKIQDERNRLDAKGKFFKAEEVEENQHALLFSAMTEWYWYNPTGNKGDEGFDENADLTFHGKKPEFNKANVSAVLNELEWVGDQISTAISDEQSFFDTSKAN